MRFEFRQVDVDHLVVLALGIRLEVVVEFLGVSGDMRSTSSFEVLSHLVVEWEKRGGGTNLGTHVTDGSHTGTRQGLDSGTVVLDDSTSSTLDSQDTSDLEDDILGSGPSVHLSVEVDTDNLGGFEFPRDVGHDINSVGSSDTTSDHTETTSVGGVGIGTNHHETGNSVVFENDLVAASQLELCFKSKYTYMIPDPGFQKPIPYLAQAVAKKS